MKTNMMYILWFSTFKNERQGKYFAYQKGDLVFQKISKVFLSNVIASQKIKIIWTGTHITFSYRAY